MNHPPPRTVCLNVQTGAAAASQNISRLASLGVVAGVMVAFAVIKVLSCLIEMRNESVVDSGAFAGAERQQSDAELIFKAVVRLRVCSCS